MRKEIVISGNIRAKPDDYYPGGFSYVVVSPITNQGWGMPTKGITPGDIRALADHFEKALMEQAIIETPLTGE